MDESLSAGALRNLETRVALSVDAVLQAQDDLNRARLKAGMEPAEPRVILLVEARIREREVEAAARAAARDDARAEADARIARPNYSAWRQPAAAPKPAYHDPLTCLRTIVAMLGHPGLTREDWPSMIKVLTGLAARDAGSPEPTAEQLEFIAQWNDGWARRMAAVVGPVARERELSRHRKWWQATQDEGDEDENGEGDEGENADEDEDEDEDNENEDAAAAPPVRVPRDHKSEAEPVVVATAEMIARSAAIARGEITPLPTDPIAREIIRQDALRRGEKDPTL
jgi:hypothetical protein